MTSIKVILVFLSMFFIVSCKSSTEAESNHNAPSDHTISKEGIMHKAELNDPESNCVSCHGADLRGSDKAPSCYSCHGKKW